MRLCTIDGCNKKHMAKSFCNTHYFRYLRHGSPHIVKQHKMSNTPIYVTWQGMKDRCLNPNYKGYHNYGGRGITVCDRWMKFENFYADMGEKPDGMQIDRINNDGNYTPENCHWATPAENSRNRQNTVLSLGKAKQIRTLRKTGLTLSQISKKLNVKLHNVEHVLYSNSWTKCI